jgi:hypothetical protein
MRETRALDRILAFLLAQTRPLSARYKVLLAVQPASTSTRCTEPQLE